MASRSGVSRALDHLLQSDIYVRGQNICLSNHAALYHSVSMLLADVHRYFPQGSQASLAEARPASADSLAPTFDEEKLSPGLRFLPSHLVQRDSANRMYQDHYKVITPCLNLLSYYAEASSDAIAFAGGCRYRQGLRRAGADNHSQGAIPKVFTVSMPLLLESIACHRKPTSCVPF